MSKYVYGWHFIPSDRRLGYEDGRLVEAGKTYKVDCDPVLCESGLHWSERAIDALSFQRGPVACRVRSVRGHRVIEGNDKVVSTARHVIAVVDATDILWRLSRKWAADAFWQHFKREDYPDVVAWLDNGDFSRKPAAESAARSAVYSAAESAAYSAAYSAVYSAAWSAVWSAAGSAAWSAAWSAARSAARSAMNSELEAALSEAMGL